MEWLNSIRKSLAKLVATLDDKRPISPAPNHDSLVTTQRKAKKDSLSPQGMSYTSPHDRSTPSSRIHPRHIPTPVGFDAHGRARSAKATGSKVFISTRPESVHKLFPSTEYVYKTRAELIASPVQDQVWEAWRGGMQTLEAVLDILLREDVVARLKQFEDEHNEGRRGSGDSADAFLNGDKIKKRSSTLDLRTTTIFNRLSATTVKDVEIVISKLDDRIYVKKPDGRYYKIKVRTPSRGSRRSLAMLHRESRIFDDSRDLESEGYLTDESEYELLSNTNDELFR